VSDEMLQEIRSMREALSRMSARLDALERQAGSPAPIQPVPASSTDPIAVAIVGARAPRPVAPARPSSRENLEVTIGRYWLNRLGILSLVLGTAFFLVYSFQYLGPPAKIAMGYGVGVALLILGLRLERKPGLAWYALGLMGGGWAVLYFTTYGMYHVPETKILSSAAVDAVLLLVVAAGAVRHALTKRSQTLTMLAFLLGFLTTGISEVTGFTFLSSVILIGSLVILAVRFRWHLLLLYGVIASYLTHLFAVEPHIAHAASAFPSLTPEQSFFWLNGAFLTLYFLGYSLGALALDEKEESRQSALLTATVLNGPVFALTLLPLLPAAYPGRTYLALLLLGLISLALSLVAGRRGLRAVSSAHLLLGLTFATIAIPLQLTHRWTSVLWYAEVAILSTLGVRFDRWAYRLFALLLGFTSLIWVFPYELAARTRFEASGWSISWPWTIGLAAILCYGIAAFVSRRLPADRHRWDLERNSFHLYAGFASVVLWVLTVAETSLPRVPLYWSLEAVGVTLLGWAIRDRGIRLIGALWFLAPAVLVLASFMIPGIWNRSAAITVLASLYATGLLYRATPPAPQFHVERHLTVVYVVGASLFLAGVLWHDLAPRWLSPAWALEGLALVVIGFRLPDKYYRVSGLVLFTILLLKILFVDLAAAQTIYRILSFVAAGVILLLASYGYARFNARESRPANPPEPSSS